MVLKTLMLRKNKNKNKKNHSCSLTAFTIGLLYFFLSLKSILGVSIFNEESPFVPGFKVCFLCKYFLKLFSFLLCLWLFFYSYFFSCFLLIGLGSDLLNLLLILVTVFFFKDPFPIFFFVCN